MNVDPAAEPEFNEWYNTEHLPQLAAVPGVLSARRFRAAERDRTEYLALYHLRHGRVAFRGLDQGGRHAVDRRMRPHFRDMLVLRMNRFERRA